MFSAQQELNKSKYKIPYTKKFLIKFKKILTFSDQMRAFRISSSYIFG